MEAVRVRASQAPDCICVGTTTEKAMVIAVMATAAMAKVLRGLEI